MEHRDEILASLCAATQKLNLILDKATALSDSELARDVACCLAEVGTAHALAAKSSKEPVGVFIANRTIRQRVESLERKAGKR